MMMRRRKSSWFLLLVLLAGIAIIGSYSLSWGLTTTGIGTITQVTTEDGQWNAQAAWLSNMSIVYHKYFDDTIHKISTDGLGDTNISDPGAMYYCDSKPVVSSDGKWIVFQRNVNNDCASVWKMDPNGLNQSAIVSCDPLEDNCNSWPSISPDGNLVAYRCGAAGDTTVDLCVVPFTGGTPTQLTIGDTNPQQLIGWLGTGGVRRSTRTMPQVLTSLQHYVPLPVDGTYRDVAKVSLTGVTTWLADITNDLCTHFPKVDPLGKIVYQDDTNNYGDVMIMNADGTGKVRLTSSAGTGNACYNHPEPHTSGQYIAFWSNVNDAMTTTIAEQRVWIMTRNGMFAAPITTEADVRDTGNFRYNLEFSPNGAKLLFIGCASADDGATCSSGVGQVWVLTLDTADTDGDGLLNWQEVVYGTNPAVADTDGGGEIDGSEALYGKDPTNPADDLQSTTNRRTR
jgi:hypothetical protein